MKTFYFVVEKQLDIYDESVNGLKNITVYDIIDNVPSILTDIETDNENNSKSEVDNWLNDNYYDKTEFNLIQL